MISPAGLIKFRRFAHALGYCVSAVRLPPRRKTMPLIWEAKGEAFSVLSYRRDARDSWERRFGGRAVCLSVEAAVAAGRQASKENAIYLMTALGYNSRGTHPVYNCRDEESLFARYRRASFIHRRRLQMQPKAALSV